MSDYQRELRRRVMQLSLAPCECHKTTVADIYARDGIDLPPVGREAHAPKRFRVHVSVLLAEAVAA